MPDLLAQNQILYKDESFKIVGAAMEVHRELGPGFLEAVYQEALEIEFKNKNIPYKREVPLEISYKSHTLKKKYAADFICYDKIIVETKALCDLNSEHQSQLLNYLKATNKRLGILINFGKPRLQPKRTINNLF